MRVDTYARRQPWPSALVVAVGVLLLGLLSACGAALTPTPGSGGELENGGSAGTNERQSDLVSSEDGDTPVSSGTLQPLPAADYQRYSWTGVVVEGDIEGPHLVIDRGCDTWVLMPGSDELAAKLQESVGQRVEVWGEVSTDPSIFMRDTVKVSAVHGEGDPRIMIYIPTYPCPGEDMPNSPPVAPEPMPYYGGIDLQDGEIAAVGKLVQNGDRWYLETAGGRIALRGDIRPIETTGEVPPERYDPAAPPPPDCALVDPVPGAPTSSDAGEGEDGGVSYGCATTPGVPGVDDDWDNVGYVAPAICRPATDDTLVVGRWSVDDGALAIDVRYSQPWGNYVCDYPQPAHPEPQPLPDENVGVLYGRVDVGPLCPVEPCGDDVVRETFAGKLLLAESPDGDEAHRIELTGDGWFKHQLPVGDYILSMPDCPWLGCDAAFPMDTRVAYGDPMELVIAIDTGIR